MKLLSAEWFTIEIKGNFVWGADIKPRRCAVNNVRVVFGLR